MKKLTVGSLFAGIGGFDLGLERAGMEIKWQVEIDPFCRKVLEKHWPNVRRYEDVRHCTTKSRADLIMDAMAACGCGDAPSCPITYHGLESVDVLCGGFPCQPVSVAGKRRAQDDRRWLWPDFARLIRELGPRYVIVENVPGLFTAGFDYVLGDLAALGFDAEWECLPASAFGAPHIRERIWVVAYAGHTSGRAHVAQRDDSRSLGVRIERREANDLPGVCRADVADANGSRPQERFVFAGVPCQARCDDDGQDAAVGSWWTAEPDVGRVAHGVPARVDRLRGLGNAIVPQIAQWIGERIIECERANAAQKS